MQAYICLTNDQDGNQCWALATGDGVDAEFTLLGVGRLFTPGDDIREAMAELEAWARDNGYDLITPQYSLNDWSLQDLIEPEVFDEVFGDEQE